MAVTDAVSSRRDVLGDGLRPSQVVVRHVIPRLAEATLVPSSLFYVFWRFVGPWAAMVAALTYAFVLIVRRVTTGRPLPALVVIVTVGLTVRTIVSLGSGDRFVYFLLPALGTALVAAVFLASVLVGRPLVNRLAAEFCPLTTEAAGRRGVLALFRHLTLFWAAVLLLNSVLTLLLLLTLPVDTFVTAKTIINPGLTCSAAAFTVAWSVRVARREGLAAPSRRLRARAVAA